jgi:predicted alpha/beta superfamily hydrolase
VTSRITGRKYEISVALPNGYAEKTSSYPVLYALDANAQFGTVVEAARYLAFEGVPELIVVGVGYPSGSVWNQLFPRLLDLSPWPDSAFLAMASRQYSQFGTPEGSGGGPAFLRFLREELVPAIDRDYRTVPTDRAIYGHSLAGLFAVYALLEGEGTFQRVIAGSPEIPWGGRRIFPAESLFASAHKRLPGRLFLSAGGSEREAMLTNLKTFLDTLGKRRYVDLTVESFIFEGEDHISVIPATISRGLRSVYRR